MTIGEILKKIRMSTGMLQADFKKHSQVCVSKNESKTDIKLSTLKSHLRELDKHAVILIRLGNGKEEVL